MSRRPNAFRNSRIGLISVFASAVVGILGVGAIIANAQNEAPDPSVLVSPDQLTDREIQWAIEALKTGLYDLQGAKGTWERQYPQGSLSYLNSHEGGQTALAVLALLDAGESYQEKRLRPALDFLASRQSDYTYVRSLRAHIWAMLPQRFMKALNAERTWLLGAYGYNSGSWNYTSIEMNSGYDNSLTQYGVLGLWEAAKRGLPVPPKLWKRVEDHYLRTQLLDGGWNYRPQWSGARGSMTAAGLTCLFITQDFLHAADYLGLSRHERPEEQAIQKGLQWLDENFTTKHHPGGPGKASEYYFYYYLYGIERVGLASGYRRFADQDWFRSGASAIIERMCDPVFDSAHRLIGYRVKPRLGSTGDTEVRVVQLSFALMFLSHGRMPIVVSKLRDDELAWNNRPRDAAHLARWVGDEVEERRNWQILDIDRPMEEWFDGPMVYFATQEPLKYVDEYHEAIRRRNAGSENWEDATPTRFEQIRRYLELGGLMITNADGHRKATTDSIRELALTMFPNFKWRRLPEDHWAYTLSSPVVNRPVLYGLTNGVRDLIIHFEKTDVGAALQADNRNRDADIFATVSNIYYYASERGLTRARLELKLFGNRPEAALDPGVSPRSVTIWRGVYSGNWNPEPAADEMIAQRLHAHRALDLSFMDVPLSDLADFNEGIQGHLLWVRGTDTVKFSEQELQGLREYLDRGGVVFFENVGGVSDFGRTAEETIRSIYAEKRFRRTTRHPLITGEGMETGQDASRVTYRLYSLDRFGTRETKSRIRTLNPRNEKDGPNVFVSRDDLSYSMLDQPRWGISGYIPRDAEKLIGNLIEFSMSKVER